MSEKKQFLAGFGWGDITPQDSVPMASYGDDLRRFSEGTDGTLDARAVALTDENGDMVVSKLDEKTLQEIASATGGAYVRATKQSIGLKEIIDRLKELDESDLATTRFEAFDEQYQYPLVVALLLLLVEWLILDRRNPLLARFNVFGRKEE